MDNHAVPRQITSFEFKLLGFFTVRQGIYLAIFAGLTVIVFFLIPVPILNFIFASLTAALGVALVFYRHNERSMDVWIRNLIISLMKPSQYFFHKDNPIPAFLEGVYFRNDVQAHLHVDAHKKLSSYLSQTGQTVPGNTKVQEVSALLHATPVTVDPVTHTATVPTQPAINQVTPSDTNQASAPSTPFLSGVIKNNKEVPLPNIMVYVNTDAGQLVRILKTNHNGVFATFHPLPTGDFIVSPKDLSGTYFFDTINIALDGPQTEPIQVYSKELL